MQICSMCFDIFQNEIRFTVVVLGVVDFQRHKRLVLHANVLGTAELFVLNSGNI